MKNSSTKTTSQQPANSTLTSQYDANGDYSTSSSTASTASKADTKSSKAKYGTLTAEQDANNDYQ